MKTFNALHKYKVLKLFTLVLVMSWHSVFISQAFAGSHSQSWIKRVSDNMTNILQNGNWDIYITGYGWHGRGYSTQRRHELNQFSYGGGFGKSLVDENGNQNLLYGFVFSDSHHKPQPIIGYGKQWFKKISCLLSLGAGYTAAITSRTDILSGIPVPVVLPVFSIKVSKVSLMGTFLPKLSSVNKGDVLFVWGRIEF